VVVGVEPTPAAFAAARAARDLASLLGTSLEMRHIVPPPFVLSRWSAHAEAAQRQRLDEARTRLADAAPLRDLTSAAVEISSGTVAEELAAAVRIGGGRNPLLVLGRRPRAERGNIAVRVLALSEVPVLMYLPDR
jgi:nucleotide-binding universal stress UspA family protein